VVTGQPQKLPPEGDEVAAAAQQTIMVGELHHRLQNTLAVVLALSRLTARTVDTVEEFQTAFGQRIEAMARTNALLLRGQIQAVSVQIALEAELQQYLDDKGQVTLLCDPLSVSPDVALGLSLIFHELATNAAKYGALAKPSGRLVVECRSDPLGGVMRWRETVTTPVAPSTRKGSGSLLIDRLGRSLGGVTRIEILPTGLEATITFKLANRQT
jgi:two-component sensor histidine kinase